MVGIYIVTNGISVLGAILQILVLKKTVKKISIFNWIIFLLKKNMYIYLHIENESMTPESWYNKYKMKPRRNKKVMIMNSIFYKYIGSIGFRN